MSSGHWTEGIEQRLRKVVANEQWAQQKSRTKKILREGLNMSVLNVCVHILREGFQTLYSFFLVQKMEGNDAKVRKKF